MGLAVLSDAIGERLHAPVLGLGDLAAHPFDDVFVLIGEFIHLLRAKILARKEYVLVKRHAVPFLFQCNAPAPSPSSLSERLDAQKAETPGRRASGPAAKRPSVRFPTGIVRSAGLYVIAPKR